MLFAMTSIESHIDLKNVESPTNIIPTIPVIAPHTKGAIICTIFRKKWSLAIVPGDFQPRSVRKDSNNDRI